MKTVEQLLKSKGREVMADSSLQYLAKRGELISPIVAECHTQAVAALGADAGADALARRTALLVLKRIAHVPGTPTPEPQPAAEEQPGHFTQPGGNE